MARLAAAAPGATWTERRQVLRELEIHATGVGLDPDAPSATLAALGQAARTPGVALVQASCYVNLQCADAGLLQHNQQRLRRAIRLAAQLGIESVVSGPGHMHPGRPMQVYAAHPDNWTARAMDRLVASCEAVVPATEGTPVKLCLEPWCIHTLNSPARLEELIRRVNHPGLRILLDPVNLVDLQTYFRTADLINECFDRLGEAIWIVHAKDTILLESAFTYHLAETVPGRGLLAYAVLLRRMKELPKRTPLFVEHLRTREDLHEAVQYIRAVAAEVQLELL